jgi:hypothetical protein
VPAGEDHAVCFQLFGVEKFGTKRRLAFSTGGITGAPAARQIDGQVLLIPTCRTSEVTLA